MIDYQTYCQIHWLAREKQFSAAQIAAELGLNQKTVEQWLARESYQRRRAAQRSSKLDPFKRQIQAMLERYRSYSAQQILQELRAQGYSGGYSILKEYVRLVRPVAKAAYLSLHFGPGECAQVDWGSFGSISVGGTRRKLSFFVMVLCYSRLMYVEFTLSQAMDQFLSCHQRAFEFLGGVPARVMIDNLKTGVLDHPPGEKPVFHPRYLDFAAHHGFTPVACGVRQPQEKGRVENGIGYAKKNFLAGLEMPSFPAINPAALQWLRTVANVRVHGETRRKPIDLFEEEKSKLRALPPLAYDCAVLQPVSASNRCRIVFETNRYSISSLRGAETHAQSLSGPLVPLSPRNLDRHAPALF